MVYFIDITLLMYFYRLTNYLWVLYQYGNVSYTVVHIHTYAIDLS